MRVVPADTWQAKLVVAMLEHFNWTYVAIIYSAGQFIVYLKDKFNY